MATSRKRPATKKSALELTEDFLKITLPAFEAGTISPNEFADKTASLVTRLEAMIARLQAHRPAKILSITPN
jgi:hypothetical protein